MDIISYFSENHAHLFYLMAGISFVIELTILGLSGPLLFFRVNFKVHHLLVALKS